MKSYLRVANLLLLPLLCLAMSPSNSRAELAQSYYATLQYVAPEALTIRVTKTLVSRTGDGKNAICKVCVEAIVEGISLSTSMLQIGNRIVIEYETVERRDPIPDAKPIPVLQVCEICPAFLVGTNVRFTYKPAARGYSFTKASAAPELLQEICKGSK